MVEVIRGALKDYAWGIPDGLVAWSGERTGAPQAELWFGAHPGAPSPLVGQEVTLDTVVSPGDVPLLTKLLAAAQPLSIQVHPDAQLARVSFDRQDQPGSDQVYSDANEKTELLIAIEEFEVFAGWRDRLQAHAILMQIDGTENACSILENDGPIAAIPALRAIDHERRAEQLVSAVQAVGASPAEVDAFATIAQLYPDDPGLLVSVLLQFRALAPGNAMYVPAGVPHSYIRGLGLEVMTSSDNVVRLGLTPKPVFVDAALAALKNSHDEILFRSEFGERIAPAGAPFAAMLTSNETQLESGAFRLVLAIEGEASVRAHGGGATVSLQQGEAAVLSAGEPAVLVSTAGVVAVVEHVTC